MKRFLKIFMFIAAVAAISTFTSCSDDEETPDYVGTWSQTETFDQSYGDIRFQMITKVTLVLTESNYTMSMKMGEKADSLVEKGGEKGTISANGNKLTKKITSFGSYDDETDKVVWYNEGGAEFKEEFATVAEQTDVAEYKVAGNKLTIISEGDTTILTKE